MKKNIKRLLAVAALAAAPHIQAEAVEPLLTPRAQENQIRIVPGMTEDKLDRTFKPRGAYAFQPKVKSAGKSRDLVRENRGLVGSPRAIEQSTANRM